MEENQIQSSVLTEPASSVTEKPYAKFTPRYAASVLDGIITGLITLLALIPLVLLGNDPKDSLLLNLVSILIPALYNVLLVKKHSATWGKKFFKVKIVPIDGKPMTWGKAFMREILGKFLSSIVLMIGYAWFFFNKKKQTLHDKLAYTVVVQEEELSKGRKIFAFILAYGLVIIALLGIAAVVLLAINPLKVSQNAKDAQEKAQQINEESQRKMDEMNSMYDTSTPSYINPDTGVPDSSESF